MDRKNKWLRQEFTPELVKKIITGSMIINRKRQELKIIIGMLVSFLKKRKIEDKIIRFNTIYKKCSSRTSERGEIRISLLKENDQEAESVMIEFVIDGQIFNNVEQVPAKYICQFHKIIYLLIMDIADKYPDIKEELSIFQKAAETAE